MSRLAALAAQPRRTVGALAVVLTAVGVTVGSGADFTAHSANPSNTFSSGTLTIDNSKEGTAILTASTMKPGSTASGTVDIQNSGTVGGAFSLSTSGAADSTPSLLGQLDLKISDCGEFVDGAAPSCASATLVHNGKISAVGTKQLGSFDADEKHRYTFDLTLPTSTDDTFQGKSASVTFDWNAVTT